MNRLHLDWKLQSMSPAIDGEYILYDDHVEAMKRIAGDGAQQEPVDWQADKMAMHAAYSQMPNRNLTVYGAFEQGWKAGKSYAAPAPKDES